MTREEAIVRALAMPADVPGVGRLCQELLADLSGQALTWRSPAPVVFALSPNPFGRRGKPAGREAAHV